MATTRELSILITARNMASGALNSVRGDIKGIQSEAKRGLQNTARNLGMLGVAAGGVLATQVQQGLVSLGRLETIAAQTGAVIESTGAAANVTAEQIREQADQIERLTGIESESIQEGQNLLLTFTDIRNEVGKDNDIFTQATDIMTDMSVALGKDAADSAILLGKALNDPIRGVAALRRVGVQLTEEQEDSIKAFVEQNDIMSAQKVILAELDRQFGGSASAFGDTAQGRLQKMQHAWGALQEQLAIGVLPVLERVGARLTEMFNDPKAAQIAQDIGEGIGEGLESAIDIATKLPWDAIGTTFSLMGQGAKTVLGMFTSMPPWVQTAILTGWGLNKLSGGALGNIVGALGSGLIKGVLGMNAGVVNINAATVNGAPGGGVAGGKGGLGRLLGGALAVTGGVVAGAHIGTALNEQSVAPARDFANEQIKAVIDSGDAGRIQNAIQTVKDALEPDDFAQGIALGLDINGVRTTLEEQLTALQAAEAEVAERNKAAKEEQRRTVDMLRSEGQLSRDAIGRVRTETQTMRATAERQRLDALSSDASMLGTLAQIRDKASRINLTVNTSITVSAAAVNKQLTSYRESLGQGGFI